jgi:Fe-S oxidoreductase
VVPDPSTTQYFGFPGYAFLWLLTLVSFSTFGHRVFRHLSVLRRARPENRWDDLPQRLRYVLVQVFGQRRLLDEPGIGLAHFFIFWAFVFFATGFFWVLLKGLFPSLPIPYADEVGWMASAMEVLAVLGLAGLIVAAVRRYLFTPLSLERTRDATLILILIAVVLLTFLSGQGFKALAGPALGGAGVHEGAWSPVSPVVGRIFASAGIAPQSAPRLFLWMWWAHMVTVLGFLAYLPYSKHLHLLASPFGVFFTALRRGGVPAVSEGASRLQEFTWRQLFSALACAECGRCDRSCPAFQSGFPLSPKTLMRHMKELVFAPAPATNLGAASATAGGNGQKIVGDIVRASEIWSCATCYACMERCPVFNEHIPLIIEMRRHLVTQGEFETRLQEALTNLGRYGNSFGQSPRARARWTQSLEFKIKDARKEPVEYLWFVGDYASYDPRLQAVTQAAARVFHRAGLDFGILYESEQNSGNDARRVGEEGLFDMLREKNRQMLDKAQYEKIFTTDPHTYQALKNEYANGSGNGMKHSPVLHYTELLDMLLRTGKLPLRNTLSLALTYHDPCYLGRYNGVYEPPRRVLKELGVKLLEMPRSRSWSYCCGAGGGRIWMEDVPGIKERPAESRVREAAALRGVSILAVACPKDLVMFQDAIKTAGLEQRLAVKDVIQLIEDAIGAIERSDPGERAQA